jgi:hypothetical protein
VIPPPETTIVTARICVLAHGSSTLVSYDGVEQGGVEGSREEGSVKPRSFQNGDPRSWTSAKSYREGREKLEMELIDACTMCSY